MTIGFIVRCGFSSMAITELNNSPVLFTPTRSRCGLSTGHLADQRERLGDALDRELVFDAPCGVWTALLLVSATQRPNRSRSVRARAGTQSQLPVIHGLKWLKSLDQQSVYLLSGRQTAGRNIGSPVTSSRFGGVCIDHSPGRRAVLQHRL